MVILSLYVHTLTCRTTTLIIHEQQIKSLYYNLFVADNIDQLYLTATEIQGNIQSYSNLEHCCVEYEFLFNR